MTEPLLIERAGAVATLVLNRPDSHNAITLDMYRALPGLLAGLDGDPAVKVMVVRGAGEKSFASGADISEFREVRGDADSARPTTSGSPRAERALERLRKPTIAMVHGYCIGGGAGLALACDLRFADERARFAITPAKLGLVYSLESTKRLVDLVGPVAGEVDPVVRPACARPACAASSGCSTTWSRPTSSPHVTYEFAELLCYPRAVQRPGGEGDREPHPRRADEEDDGTRELRNSSFDTDDYAEGVRAFLEKRPPEFTWS